jgi:hypothetical protein
MLEVDVVGFIETGNMAPGVIDRTVSFVMSGTVSARRVDHSGMNSAPAIARSLMKRTACSII